MLTTPLRAGWSESEHNSTITMADESYELFHSVLEFMYKGDTNIDAENAQSLIMAAHKFDMPGLKRRAAAFIFSQLSIDNLLLATKIDIQKTPGEELHVDLVQIDTELVGLELDPLEDVVLGSSTTSLLMRSPILKKDL